MDIDGVMTHRGSVLFLEAKSNRDKVVEVMNMDEKSGTPLDEREKFERGEKVFSDIKGNWATINNWDWDKGQRVLFERLVAFGEGRVSAFFPYGRSILEMEGYGRIDHSVVFDSVKTHTIKVEKLTYQLISGGK